jgi:ABC-type branched-subunit amino acid transport system ATPase component
LVAVLEEGDRPVIAGGGRYIVVCPGEAEIASVVVDQNVRTVLDVADRIYVMHLGRIVHEGTAAALRDDADARTALGLAA